MLTLYLEDFRQECYRFPTPVIARRVSYRSLGPWLSGIIMLIVAACNVTTGPAKATTTPRSRCEPPASIVRAPSGTGLADGVWVGSAFITASWRDGAFQPRFPTKIVIHIDGEPITLSGFRCSDARPLHFWYDKGPPPFQPPVEVDVLESSGDGAVLLAPDQRPDMSHGGYIFFPTAGSYALIARSSTKSDARITVVTGPYKP
jgi:hypothetical protein